jgi:tRNA threonylcarbamoyladenosine biosynthesis protein TsaB
MSDPRLLLALDAGSPLVSVAVGDDDGRVLAQRAVEIRRSSERLLALIDEALAEAGAGGPRALAGILALRGPGSFTGLRVGLATALGLHQALAVPAAALSTLEVLATAASPPAGEGDEEGRGTVLAVVDALRGEWFTQPYHAGEPTAEPQRLPLAELARFAPATVVGFGIAEALAATPRGTSGLSLMAPPPLAPLALALIARRPRAWNPDLLTRPLYLRAPAVTLPTPPS